MPPAIPDIDSTQAVGLVGQLFSLIHQHNYWAVVALLFTAALYGVHYLDAARPSKWTAWTRTWWGTLLLTAGLQSAGAALHALLVGHPLNAELGLTVLQMFVTTIATYVGARFLKPLPGGARPPVPMPSIEPPK